MTNNELDNNNTTPRFVVMTSAAKVPTAYNTHYRNIALVETDGQGMPKMISERARHLVRIVDAAYGVHVGKTNRSYGYRRLQDMRFEAARLNRQ